MNEKQKKEWERLKKEATKQIYEILKDESIPLEKRVQTMFEYIDSIKKEVEYIWRTQFFLEEIFKQEKFDINAIDIEEVLDKYAIYKYNKKLYDEDEDYYLSRLTKSEEELKIAIQQFSIIIKENLGIFLKNQQNNIENEIQKKEEKEKEQKRILEEKKTIIDKAFREPTEKNVVALYKSVIISSISDLEKGKIDVKTYHEIQDYLFEKANEKGLDRGFVTSLYQMANNESSLKKDRFHEINEARNSDEKEIIEMHKENAEEVYQQIYSEKGVVSTRNEIIKEIIEIIKGKSNEEKDAKEPSEPSQHLKSIKEEKTLDQHDESKKPEYLVKNPFIKETSQEKEVSKKEEPQTPKYLVKNPFIKETPQDKVLTEQEKINEKIKEIEIKIQKHQQEIQKHESIIRDLLLLKEKIEEEVSPLLEDTGVMKK